MSFLKVVSITAMLIFWSAITLAQETSLDLRKDGRVVTGNRKDFFLRKVATNEFKVTDHLRNRFKSSDVLAIVIPPGQTDGRYLIGVVLNGGTLPDDWPVSKEDFDLLRAFAINRKLAKAESATRGVRAGFASASNAMVNSNTAELQSLMAEDSGESKVAVAYAGYLLQDVDKAGEIAILSEIVTKYRQAENNVVQDPDATYAIIEYPKKKEVTISLTPVDLQGAKGVATIRRDDDATRIRLRLSDVPANVTGLTVYAVDETGTVTALGPIAISNGTGILLATTPLSHFMLIASPEPALRAYDHHTNVMFRSAVPEGFAVIPMRSSASGERVAAVTSPNGNPYAAALLGIPNFKRGDDTKLKVDFSGALTGARAKVFLTPRQDGPTEIRMSFHDLKEPPAGQKFIVWAVGSDGSFQKLGQLVNMPGRNEAEIKSETTLPDFALVVTMESWDSSRPWGPTIAYVYIVP